MSALVMLAVLAAALLHAGWNTLVKGGRDPFVNSARICAGAAVVALPVGLATGLPGPASYPYVLASAAIHGAYFLLIGFVYRRADLSVAYPLMRGGAPLLTSAAAFLLIGEKLSPAGLLGVLGLSAGVLWLAADGMRRGGLTPGALGGAALNALVIAAYTLVDGQGGRLSGDPIAYNAWMEVANALVFLPIATAMRGRGLVVEVAAGWRVALIGGGAGFLAYGIAIWAMTQAPIGLVAALRETSVIFAAAFGALFLKERFGAARVAGAALVVAGLGALRFA